MNRIILVLIICGIGIGSCKMRSKTTTGYSPDLSSDDYSNWIKLSGKWYGILDSKDGKSEWLAQHNPDGTYVIQFKITDKTGTIEKMVESGEWGLSGNIFFTTFKYSGAGDTKTPVDATDPYNRDAYKILKLDETSFKYEHVRTGIKLEAQKVAKDFSLK